MSDYIVSARKYRPDSFESLIGQDNIARTLKNSITRGQLAHAYLFCGPRGVGKTSAARIFAKTINCSNPSADMEPCGECESCKSFAEGRSYCIHELDAASNNGVDDIKMLMDQVQIPPQVGRYSVYIIDEVHMLSSQAFNAFLKTLEEPPAHAIFILATTEKHKILPTILSRCQTYDFNRISIPDIVRNLRSIAAGEGISIDDESMHVIAQKADGAMRDALTIFDQTVAFCGTDIKYQDVIGNLNVLDYEYSFRLVESFLEGDYATPFLILDEILAKGFNAQYFISSLGSHFRDLLVSRTGGLEALLDFPDSLRQRYAGQAQKCSVKFLYDALDITSQCEAGYKAAVNQRLHIEFALMKLAFLVKDAASSAVVTAKAESTVSAPAKPASAPRAAVAAFAAPKQIEVIAPASVDEPIDIILDEIDIAAPVEAPAPPAAPVEAPAAPVEAKAPATAAAPARKAAKSGASLSLASLIEEDTPKVVQEQKVSDELPSDQKILDSWAELSGQYEDRPRLSNMLKNAKLSIAEADGCKNVSFAVINEAQKTWVEQNFLRNFEAAFQKKTGSSKVRLFVDVIPEEQVEKKAYMPSEQARELIDSNPEVREFVSELGLDIR
ncbi:MAG: DNA polymerase III subunit gamma/tau [Bacteroidales bacterium]|nr:DNA polymerase III subunit gamma/tau [Bacteroidales bacterium]